MTTPHLLFQSSIANRDAGLKYFILYHENYRLSILWFIPNPVVYFPNGAQVAPHLSLEEVQERYKKADDPIVKARFLAIYHALQGRTAR